MVREIICHAIMTDREVEDLAGHYIDHNHYHTTIDNSWGDVDVYYIDSNGQKKILTQYRVNVIPDGELKEVIKSFKNEAKKSSSIRGIAGGPVDPHKISSNVERVVSDGNFRSRVVYKNGQTSKYYVSNKVNSLIAGYFDKPKLSRKHDILKNGHIPCRTTAFTEKRDDQWKKVLPVIERVDQYYQRLQPERHQKQLDLAKLTPQYQIGETAFSTITVNYNWRTACHLDSGDFSEGYSGIFVGEEGSFEGGYLGYPQYGVCLDLRHGDFALMNPHEYHCNTTIRPLTKDWTRLSVILYYREKMQLCSRGGNGGPKPKLKLKLKLKAQTGTEIINIKGLKIMIRPKTTDEKVVKEIFSQNVYQKKRVKDKTTGKFVPFEFGVEKGDVWLDLGANIGTFTLSAISQGAQVIACEPESSNLELLEKNLDLNGMKAVIIPGVVTTSDSATNNLYICNGDYNKYRHTIYHKRGRKSITVKNFKIIDILEQYHVDCIKMDIEGAEIDILEYLDPSDYERFGIRKLVFEYSFDIDPSIPRFRNIINRLQQYFRRVHFTKVNLDEEVYKYYPPATIVHCMI